MSSTPTTTMQSSEEDLPPAGDLPKGSRITFQKGCPCCERSFALERVPRSFLLKYMLFFIPARVYHCYNCQHTFTRIG